MPCLTLGTCKSQSRRPLSPCKPRWRGKCVAESVDVGGAISTSVQNTILLLLFSYFVLSFF